MLEDIIYDAGRAVADYVAKEGAECNGESLGLNPIALYRGWVTPEALVVYKADLGMLEYYGGFEYVDPTARAEVGSYVIYWRGEARLVDSAIEHFESEFAE